MIEALKEFRLINSKGQAAKLKRYFRMLTLFQSKIIHMLSAIAMINDGNAVTICH